jgi:TRAP-type mannitol/chloroaromatic compound transport system substrate-binding protein
MQWEKTMNRRKVLNAVASAPFAAAALAAPSIARSETKVQWRMPTSFPTSLATLYGTAVFLTERVAALTDGGFKITPYAGGEILPPNGILEGTQTGAVEAGFTTGLYYIGKKQSLLFDAGVPFGLSPRQHNAWMVKGGGLEMMREVYAEFNTIQFPCGNTGAQMGGWYRKPINTKDDLKGLRIRAAGLVGAVFSELGAVPQQIPGSDLYPALERGTLDAVEYVGPYDDEVLGFHKVAKYYYSPGVLELGASDVLLANIDAYNALPPAYQAALQSAAAEANTYMLASYDHLNVAALRRLVEAGVQLMSWSDEIMREMKAAAEKILTDRAAGDPQFAKIYEAWRSFRDDQILWGSINDAAAANFLIRSRA